jgi:hypothetical protein
MGEAVNESDLRAYFRRGGALAFESSASGPMLERLARMSCLSDGTPLESRGRQESRAWDHRDGESRARLELAKMGVELPPDWEELVESEDPSLTADYRLVTRNVAILPHDVAMVQNAEVERELALVGRRYATALEIYYGLLGDEYVRSRPLGRLLPLLQVTESGRSLLAARARRYSSQGTRDPLRWPAERTADELEQNAQWPDEARSRMLRDAEDEARMLAAEARAAIDMGMS